MNWKNLLDGQCPNCEYKLMGDGKTYICPGCDFVIRYERYDELRIQLELDKQEQERDDEQ